MSRNNLKLNLFKSTRHPGRCTFGNPHIQQQQKCRTLVSSAKFRNFTYLVSFRVIDWQLKCADNGIIRRCLQIIARGVVVNFDLGEPFPRPRSQQRGSLRPRTACSRAGGGCERGSPLPIPPEIFLRFLMPNPAFGAIWARR